MSLVGDLDSELRPTSGLLGGVDEVGRGAFAGPLVVAAVVLPPDDELQGLNDSKRVTPEDRERLCAEIEQIALAMHVVIVEPKQIDARGLHRSNLWALREGLARLDPAPGHAIIDGYDVEPLGFPVTVLPEADRASRTVAAASIVAKVTRDRMMAELDEKYPGYGFAGNKGYGTGDHREALDRLGPCEVHRLSFAGVGQMSLWQASQ